MEKELIQLKPSWFNVVLIVIVPSFPFLIMLWFLYHTIVLPTLLPLFSLFLSVRLNRYEPDRDSPRKQLLGRGRSSFTSLIHVNNRRWINPRPQVLFLLPSFNRRNTINIISTRDWSSYPRTILILLFGFFLLRISYDRVIYNLEFRTTKYVCMNAICILSLYIPYCTFAFTLLISFISTT